ncbi:MAG: M14 family metallopeptidase [Chloroflexi bacterium]|nr:M14 family metallopeptidase [Chloroflexota bacterium]
MDSRPVDGAKSDYSYSLGKVTRRIAEDRVEIAKKIDLNQDKYISDKELKHYLQKPEVDVLRDPDKVSVDEEKVVKEYKTFLSGKEPAEIKNYHSYEQIAGELKALETKYPDLCKRVSLGKTFEGRDIWALKVSKGAQGDTSNKTGVVITGATHAREWPTAEIPLKTAQELVTGYDKDPAMKARLDNAEVWFVPVINPDGFTYSKTESSFWRKNRRPIEKTACDIANEGNIACQAVQEDKIKGTGVDLNRNYWDGNKEHYYLYRPPGDTPCSTWDDFSATSDSPSSDTYRGPEGASESEIQSIRNLELDHKNIKGVIDYHSYGRTIMYPWGHSYENAPNKKFYVELGNKLKNVMKDNYDVMQSADFYPASGSSEDFHQINNRISYTIEVGRSFMPGESDLGRIVEDGYNASLVFIDAMIENKV